ncbi:MAG: hypothetical protein SPI34_07075 [Opitutales bacterium]|nr:hypothetical protein [Opitutales bacterium]
MKLICYIFITCFFTCTSFAISSDDKIARANEDFNKIYSENFKSAEKEFKKTSLAKDKDLQMDLAIIYFGKKYLAQRVWGFQYIDYSDLSKYLTAGKRLKIVPDIKKAIFLLRLAMQCENSQAFLMYALMLNEGVGVEKAPSKAFELMLTASLTDFGARCYYELYYGKIAEINEHDLTYVNPKNLLSQEESPFTFIPQESVEWSYRVKNKNVFNEDKFLVDYNSLPKSSRNEAGFEKKHLVNVCAINEMIAWMSDNASGIWLVDPGQSNRFFIRGSVEIKENIIDYSRKNEDGTYAGFLYLNYIGALSNNLQVIECLDNGGGTFTSSDLYFFGFEGQDTVGHYFVGIRNFGSIITPKGTYMRYIVKDNIVASYAIISDRNFQDEHFESEINIYSFEPDKTKYEKQKKEILEEFFKHRPKQKSL